MAQPAPETALMVRFHLDGRTTVYVLTPAPGLARRLQAFASDLVENPSAALELERLVRGKA